MTLIQMSRHQNIMFDSGKDDADLKREMNTTCLALLGQCRRYGVMVLVLVGLNGMSIGSLDWSRDGMR